MKQRLCFGQKLVLSMTKTDTFRKTNRGKQGQQRITFSTFLQTFFLPKKHLLCLEPNGLGERAWHVLLFFCVRIEKTCFIESQGQKPTRSVLKFDLAWPLSWYIYRVSKKFSDTLNELFVVNWLISHFFCDNTKWKVVSSPHYLKILLKYTKYGLSYSLKRDWKSISKITFVGGFVLA